MEYELVPSTSDRMIFNNIPTPDMMKFSLPQDKTEYAVPLSLNPQNEKRWIKQPITTQPKYQRSISEPDLSPGFNPVVESPKPEIEFSLYYDEQCHTLMVHLLCAHNLPIKGKVSLDPTVVLYLLPNHENTFLSQVIHDTNPTFNQSFEFRDLLPDEIRCQTLVFRVCSRSSKGEMLGGLSLSLSEADLFGAMCRRRLDTDIEKRKVCIYDI